MAAGLTRFVAAQGPVYARVLGELRSGRKASHWMWFVFPQIVGLGTSAMAARYAIADLSEARAYLAHPVLGARYAECVAIIDALPDASAEAVFGGIDAVKLRSSLSLFEAAGFADGGELLERWYGGVRDPATLARVG